MPEFNLLQSLAAVRRDVTARLANKDYNRAVASEFGQAYFDGPREQGYGGYHYDGRWRAIARTAQVRYGLQEGQRVLDIGCAKGFFVHDLGAEIGVDAFGLDVSAYALEQAHPGIKERLVRGDARALPYADASFDAVFAINTLHNLERDECLGAIREIMRVCRQPRHCFIQVDAYRNPQEKALFEAWMLTARTYGRPADWQNLFDEAGYQGDFFWTILDLTQTLHPEHPGFDDQEHLDS